MDPLQGALSRWGSMHLGQPPPSRFEIVGSLALAGLGLGGVLFLFAQDALFSASGVAFALVLAAGAVMVQTVALRLAHRETLRRMR